MIEGIIGLFVILFLILVVPYIKDWYNNTFNPEDIVKTTYTEHEVIKTRRDGVQLHYVIKPKSPIVGDTWVDRKTMQTYVWSGTAWNVSKPQEGDLWLW